MRTFLECMPCFVSQALAAARLVSSDEAVHERVLRRVLTVCAGLELDRSPPYIGGVVHRIIREETGSPDPYVEMKRISTEKALGHLDAARVRGEAAGEPPGTRRQGRST